VTGISIVGVGLVTALLASEGVLRGTKLQTGLGRVLVVWGLAYLGVAYLAFSQALLSLVALTVCWGGAFLTWFGVRSHLESSILLRMLVLLRRQPMTEAQLVTEYTTRHGEAARLDELCRGGLANRQAGRVSLTRKGERILRVVSMLR
jgi:amino acid transporter